MTAPPWQPRLRADVEPVRDEGGEVVALLDRALERRLPAGRLTRALVARLAREPRPLEALVGETAAATDAAPAEVEDALRALLLLGLLEGAGEAWVERARRVSAGEPAPPPEVLPGARFGCLGSGACCSVYRAGPLSDDDLARLDAAAPALRAAYPDLPAAPWAEVRADDGAPRRYLRKQDGRCLFLRPGALCGVHAVAGREAKPAACRLFPFAAVRTLDGLRVFDVSECSQVAATTQRGALHADVAAEVIRLASSGQRLHHPLVLLDGETPCDYGPVLALGRALLPLARRDEEAGLRLRRCAALIRAFADALVRCSLDPGEPDATVAAVLALPARPLAAPAPEALARALEACVRALDAATREEREARAPRVDALRELLAAALALAADRAGLADGPLPEVLTRARALPLDPGPLARLLGTSLENRVFGARLLALGRLRAGVLRVGLVHTLTVVGARLQAALADAPAVRPEDLSAGHWLASLALSRPALARALAGVEQHAWTVAAGALDVASGPS